MVLSRCSDCRFFTPKTPRTGVRPRNGCRSSTVLSRKGMRETGSSKSVLSRMRTLDLFTASGFCAHLFLLERINSVDLTERLKIDRYLDQNGNVVFTERFLINRGVCCGLGCTHCPYYPKHEAGNSELSNKIKALVRIPNTS